MKKRILSLLLTLVMILGMIPATTLTANAASATVSNIHMGDITNGEKPRTLYWDAVAGAVKYTVAVTYPDGTQSETVVTTAQYALEQGTGLFLYGKGVYTFAICAKASDGSNLTATTTFNYNMSNYISWGMSSISGIRLDANKAFEIDLINDKSGLYSYIEGNKYQVVGVGMPSWMQMDSKGVITGTAPNKTLEGQYFTFYFATGTDSRAFTVYYDVLIDDGMGADEYIINKMYFETPAGNINYGDSGASFSYYPVLQKVDYYQGGVGELSYTSQTNAESLLIESVKGSLFKWNSTTGEYQSFSKSNIFGVGCYAVDILLRSKRMVDYGKDVTFSEDVEIYVDGTKVPTTDYSFGGYDFAQALDFVGYYFYVYDEKPEIKSVLVNGESVADGATYVSNGKSVTVKTTYDSVLSQALQDYGCTVKYKTSLNGVDYSNVTTSTSNGNGTSTQTYVQNVNSGSSLTFKSWLEVTWPNGSKDVVDERTTNVTYGGVKNVSVSATFSGTPANATSNTSGIKVNETRWFKVNDNGSMTRLDSSDTIAEGGTYRVYAYLAEDGDELADGYTVKINGQPATHSPSNGANTWYIEVILTGTNDYIAVDAIGLPEAYTNPVFTYDTSDVAPSRKHWDVVQVEWFECDKDGHKLSDALPADYIFLTDSYYRVEVTVTPESNWQFHSSDLGFYINGKAAQYVYYYNSDYSNSVTGYAVYNTADIEGSYELYVYDGSLSGSAKDIYIKDGQYLGSDATAPSDTKPASGGYAYYKDGVLELNGYDNEKAHFIFEEAALELWLIGDNTIGAIYDNEWDMAGGNLETRQGNLVINANPGGELVIASNPLDAYANIQVKDLYFKGGDVTSCLANGTYGAAVQLNDGNLYLEKGTAAYVSDSSDFATATKWDGTTDISDYENVWLKTVGTCRVDFLDDDNTVLDMVRVTEGNTVSEPDDPVKEGYEFIGWYTDDGDKFDFTTPITEDICLTAKFEPAASNITVNCIGDIDYTVSGNVVTVDHEVACKVGYLDGTAYKAITAVANGDGTYSFTAPAGVTEVLLVVKGDINGDGEISLADSTRTKAAYNKKTTPTTEAAFAADANGDGEITLADSTRIKAAYNKKTTLSW